MLRIGTKRPTSKVFGGKMMNRVAKFGGKALSMAGDLAPVAAVLAPPLAPALEAAKLAGLGLTGYHMLKQYQKHR
jgi:hypothetical protein